jgi:hypothetical protein
MQAVKPFDLPVRRDDLQYFKCSEDRIPKMLKKTITM